MLGGVRESGGRNYNSNWSTLSPFLLPPPPYTTLLFFFISFFLYLSFRHDFLSIFFVKAISKMASKAGLKVARPLLTRRWSDAALTTTSIASNTHTRNLAAIAAPALSYLPLPAPPPPPPVVPIPSGKLFLDIRLPISVLNPSTVSVTDPVVDENLFRYTSGRWLYNEEEQMAQRYIKFDVGALHRVIFDVCGSPVIGMEKKEGLFNKSFMCSLANGQMVTARIKVCNLRLFCGCVDMLSNCLS